MLYMLFRDFNNILSYIKRGFSQHFPHPELKSYVAQQLVAKNITLHHWESGNRAEVDFIADFDGIAIPIEVKSAENVRARSLQAFVKKYAPAYSIRISSKNFGFENNIKSIPLYALFCL